MTTKRINPLPYVEDLTQSGTIPANGAAQVAFTMPTVTGYTPAGVVMTRPATGAQSLTCVSTNIGEAALYTNWRNFTSSAVTTTFTVRVLYLPA